MKKTSFSQAPLRTKLMVLLTILAIPATYGVAHYATRLYSRAATSPGLTFVDSSGTPISQITNPTVRVQLLSPYGLSQGNSGFSLIPGAFAQTTNAVTKTYQVKAGNNDVNEESGKLVTNSSSVWLGSSSQSFTGLRFTDIDIPKGAIITSAKLQVTNIQEQWIGMSFTMYFDNVSNSGDFTAASLPSKRLATQAKTNHKSNSKWVQGQSYTLEDVSKSLQEIVNKSTWTPGNNVSLVLKGSGSKYGRKFVRSFEASSSQAPRLLVTYTASGSPSLTPSPTVAPSLTISPSSSPSPSQSITTTRALLSEDTGFNTNTVTIEPFSSNPYTTSYTFSNGSGGTKTLYVKFISASGASQIFSSTINLVQPTTAPTASPTPNMSSSESMAMHAWQAGAKTAPNPAFDKCEDGTDVSLAHKQFHVIAYDGYKYPTWHPPVVVNPITGAGKCFFGHEHGSNPQKYQFWNEIVQHFGKDQNGDGVISPMIIADDGRITPGDHAGMPFGIANEHMEMYYNQEGRDSIFVRHEDHVGHKIEIVNNEAETQGNSTHTMAQLSGTVGINVPYYKTGSNTYQPTGVVCAHLHKFHQGTNSNDAVRNNLHETIFHSKCQSVDVNGINAPAYYPNNFVLLTGMTAFGKPGEYKRFCFNSRTTRVCADGQNPDGSCIVNDPLISKLPDAINSQSLGRNMVDKYCFDNFATLNPGTNYFNPYEIWEGDFGVYTASGKMLVEHGRQWDVLDPVRYIDAALPNGIGYNQDRCNQGLPYSGNCDRGVKGAAWNSPQAAFKGLKRTTYFGRNRISNAGGATIWWTDPVGGNAVTTPFTSGLKQQFSPVEADIQKVQYRIQQVYGSDNFLNDRALQREFSNGGGTVHAPN